MDGLHLIIFFRGYVHIIILHWVIMKMNITLDVLFIGTMTDVNISWYDTNFPSNPMQLTASSYILSYVMYYLLKYYSIYDRIKTGYSQVHSIGGLGRGELTQGTYIGYFEAPRRAATRWINTYPRGASK